MSEDIVIVGAARTPVGAFNGSFATIPAHELGAAAIRAAMNRATVDPREVDEVIFGQVLTASQGQNPARQAAFAAGMSNETTAWCINQVCGSGLRAIALAAQQIRSGDARIVVAGGQESMSLAPHTVHLRSSVKMGDSIFIDTMLKDGLTDAFGSYHMGITAENVARKYQISREDQDAFAASSQNKAEAARSAGRFKDEIVPITVPSRKGDAIIEEDEYIRPGTTVETLAKLKPAFAKDGTVTAGNSSGINDGAAALVLMSAIEADRRGLVPMGRIASWAIVGVDPSMMGTGPIPASRKALEKAGWKVGDLEVVESNEAFAAQACVVNKELGWDPNIVNVNGGAIALGHPIGASGARILVTLVHELVKQNRRKALATLCIGGGMGIALTVERSS